MTIGVFINPGTAPERATAEPLAAAATAASSTTRSATSTRASCSTRSCPRSARRYNLTSDPRGAGHLRRQLGRHLRLHRRPGSGPTSSARCSATSAASRTSAAATSTRPDPQDREASRSACSCRTARNDLDNRYGNWPLANQEMAAALKFRGYDYQFEYGDGAHTASTAARSCPTRCGGCGGPRPDGRRAGPSLHPPRADDVRAVGGGHRVPASLRRERLHEEGGTRSERRSCPSSPPWSPTPSPSAASGTLRFPIPCC